MVNPRCFVLQSIILLVYIHNYNMALVPVNGLSSLSLWKLYHELFTEQQVHSYVIAFAGIAFYFVFKISVSQTLQFTAL